MAGVSTVLAVEGHPKHLGILSSYRRRFGEEISRRALSWFRLFIPRPPPTPTIRIAPNNVICVLLSHNRHVFCSILNPSVSSHTCS